MEKTEEARGENTALHPVEALSASLEDYLQAIYHLEGSGSAVRAKEIADRMNVQGASVTGALKALAVRGLVNYSPYCRITLTPAGRRAAREVVHRHDILREFFLTTLQLESHQAESNACRIEHAIDAAAVDRLVRFLEFLRICPRAGRQWLNAFDLYCRMGTQNPNCRECVEECLEQTV